MTPGQGDACLRGRAGESAQHRVRLRGRGALGQQHGGEQPARLRSGGRDVVEVHEHGGRPHIAAAERDGVAVRDQELGALQVDGGHVLAHTRRHHERRVGGEAAEERAEPLVGQLAGSERQAEADHALELGEAADDEVAVGRVRLGRLTVVGSAVVEQEGGHGARRAAGLHVEPEVADHECLHGRHAHRRRRVQHAVGRGLGCDVPVVAGDDHVEVVGGQRGEPCQRPLHGAQSVAREHADGEPPLAEPADEILGALVGS